MNQRQIAIAKQRIEQFYESKRLADYICREDGPRLIEAATKTISLRELGRKTVLSTAAFLKIANESR
jgi:hypothetical protein